ncbi:DNA polymerase III polC-type [Lachnospiraceae bacterium KM106-2]|nr:DNA polymerase III polC-type [Lachnospiraceae bacterium KM106-2]
MRKNRENKGKSIIAFPSEYVVVDIETTGLYPGYDSIIEIAALKICNDKVVGSFSSLVNEGEVYVDEFITELTGITQEMVNNAPGIETVLPEFCEFVGDSIIIGQNISFDINFLYDCILENTNKYFRNDHVNIARIFRKLYPEETHYSLADIALRCNINYEKAHRAAEDCLITYKALRYLHEEILNKYGEESEFEKLFKKNRNKNSKLKASDIIVEGIEWDEDNPLFQKTCVFTGTLQNMQRKDAMKAVVGIGGYVGDNVTKKTNYLILGDLSYCKSVRDGNSRKYIKAKEYKIKGYDIEVIPESLFYEMIDYRGEENVTEVQNYNYKEELYKMINEVIKETGIPKNSIQFNEQVDNKNKGEYLLQIFEEDWPKNTSLLNPKGVTSPVLIIKEENKGKYQGSIKIIMKKSQFEVVGCPKTVTSMKSGEDSILVHILRTDPILIPYIRKHIIHKLSIYKSKNSFSCCSQFKRCSDERHCVHENLLYSTGCFYRMHLDKDEIFYGKNRNID